MNALVPASLARKLEADLIGKGLARKSHLPWAVPSELNHETHEQYGLITGGASGIGYELTKTTHGAW